MSSGLRLNTNWKNIRDSITEKALENFGEEKVSLVSSLNSCNDKDTFNCSCCDVEDWFDSISLETKEIAKSTENEKTMEQKPTKVTKNERVVEQTARN